ncbi:MAG: DUF166 family protein [Dehalococcoidia bacterium]
MRILIVTQGPYGERIARNIEERKPSDWEVMTVTLTTALPPLIDEPEDYLPANLPSSDLIVFLSETEQAPQLIPDVVDMTGAKAVIVPVDNSQWVPEGLKNQLKKELTARGIVSVWPKTFCTLTENSYGYRHATQPYKDPTIAEFARYFGKPELSITINPETRLIENVEVIRGAPCGSTHHVAAGLIGVHADEAELKAGLLCHHYPCQASMQKEQIDKALYDTLMHLSGYLIKEEVERQVKPFKTPPIQIRPPGQ